jgi:queuine tRNA-ribosyltransferase
MPYSGRIPNEYSQLLRWGRATTAHRAAKPCEERNSQRARQQLKQMNVKPINFEVIAREGKARAGVLTTRRGVIETPVFMPVGTAGTIKGLRFEELESSDLNATIILANTYHMWLRPGAETIRACGGLHRFIGWKRPILTDSGGFQLWSLGELRRITEEGAEFRSHLDGSIKFLSPEVSMEIQTAFGSDIAMVFDECPAGKAPRDEARKSMELTVRWAKRSRERFDALQGAGADSGRIENKTAKADCAGQNATGSSALPQKLSGAQSLFGIVQGAGHLDLRRESLERTMEIGFDGYALGGLRVGEEESVMWDIVSEIAPLMPDEHPRYLMGIGTPADLVEAIARGIDMFDCVLPTRNGRNGQAFTSRGKLNVKNAQWALDTRPLDDACECSVCMRHSRAYIRHLYLAGEMLASILLTHHNLTFFLDTMRHVRQAIQSGNFSRFRQEFVEQMREDRD